ncbi:MAG TPA: hypothetical protein PK887_04190 [Ignavibacteriales bacterium]|nr:hypothetical protein [Ignavibacteriales bacterium]
MIPPPLVAIHIFPYLSSLIALIASLLNPLALVYFCAILPFVILTIPPLVPNQIFPLLSSDIARQAL